MNEDEYSREVGKKAQRKLKARQHPPRTIWLGLGMMGIVGWSVAVPTLGGALLGIWIDGHYPGKHSWTLMLLVIGLFLGAFNAWHWVSKEGREIERGEENE